MQIYLSSSPSLFNARFRASPRSRSGT
jgi:hypothetical protein